MPIVKGKDLSSIKVRRAGVIPYTVCNGRLFFLMGVDSQYNQVTDFGGGSKKDENALQTALREFNEETNGIFSNYTSCQQSFDDCIAILDGYCAWSSQDVNSAAMLFYPLHWSWLWWAQNLFNTNQVHNGEVSHIVWMSDIQLMKELNTRGSQLKHSVIWHKVKRVLSRYLSFATFDQLRGFFV